MDAYKIVIILQLTAMLVFFFIQIFLINKLFKKTKYNHTEFKIPSEKKYTTYREILANTFPVEKPRFRILEYRTKKIGTRYIAQRKNESGEWENIEDEASEFHIIAKQTIFRYAKTKSSRVVGMITREKNESEEYYEIIEIKKENSDIIKNDILPQEIKRDTQTGKDMAFFGYYEGISEANKRKLPHTTSIEEVIDKKGYMVAFGQVWISVYQDEYPQIKRRLI